MAVQFHRVKGHFQGPSHKKANKENFSNVGEREMSEKHSIISLAPETKGLHEPSYTKRFYV